MAGRFRRNHADATGTEITTYHPNASAHAGALRCGLVRPYAYMDAATAEAIEDEAIGLEFSTQPFLY